MEMNVANSMLAYSKFPQYLQPYSGLNNGNPKYTMANGAPIGSMLQLRSTHQPAVADESRLSDCYSISGFYRPTDFKGLSAGMYHSVVPLNNPSESPRSGSVASDRDSSNDGDPSMVETPREVPVNAVASEPGSSEPEEKCSGTNGTNSSPTAVAPASPHESHGITINLLDKELWQLFKSIGNEMIVTKPGR